MSLAIKKKTLFILGSLLLALFIIALFMLRFSDFSNDIIYEPSDTLVETGDPLVTQRLTERDLLPDDFPLVTILDPSRGPENAPVVIVEFSDFECPFCKDSQKVVNQIIAKYPNSIRHVWKDAPSTSLHKNAFAAHLAARCAQEQNAFWQYHNLLFENQSAFNNDIFLSLAGKLPLNTRSFEQCINSQNGKAKVERSITEAEVLGVNTTPFFFVNNNKLSGNITFEQFDQLVQQELQ